MAILSCELTLTVAVLAISCLVLASEVNKAPTINVNMPYSGKKGVLQLSEDTPLNYYLAILETKDDDSGLGGEGECRTDNPYIRVLSVYPKTYKIELVKELDRETVNLVQVSILCSDKGVPPMTSSTTFTIEIVDINDNAPTFQKKVYHANVTEGVPVGSLVTRVKATDLDSGQNGDVEYYLVNATLSNTSYFTIDKETGKIFTNTDIDRELTSQYVLTVMATDLGLPSLSNSVEVRIQVEDINDNTPVILTKELHVKENLKQMSLIGSVEAKDPDRGKNSELVFSKMEDSESSSTAPFLVHPNGDVLAVVRLDREQRQQYTMEVGVRDKGSPRLSSKAIVNIIVDDVNDNAPVITSDCLDDDGSIFDFDYRNYEDISNISTGVVFIDWYTPSDQRLVYQIKAIDEDNGENSKLRYAIESVVSGNSYNITTHNDPIFQIDQDTGSISLRRYVRKDDDLVHILNISVTDNGIPALSAFCHINITFDIDLSALTTPKATHRNSESNVKDSFSGNSAPNSFIFTRLSMAKYLFTSMSVFILFYIFIDLL